jgi:hypothetical protein
MILIDAGLELIANLKQLTIARAEVAQQLGKAAPERFSREARSRHCLLFGELMQSLGNAQAAYPDVIHMQVVRHLESAFKTIRGRPRGYASTLLEAPLKLTHLSSVG